ncbi:MAG: DUF5916 domain-containing protein [Vicinamibacterales bacterium]
MKRRFTVSCLSFVCLFLATPPLLAGPQLPPGYTGPGIPEAPETIKRDAAGKATIRAVRLEAPLKIDGRLDEALYSTYRPISDFIQTEPISGAPATERTEIWLSFDRTNVYLSARCYESHPERMIVNEMRRDGNNVGGQENIAFIFDTFHDMRNGFVFNVNPLGARADGQTSNERQYNGDWNPVWAATVGKFDGGWTVEAAIPFKSLRYAPGTEQVWGFNMRRRNRWKNEYSYITPIPNALGNRGLYQGSLAALLVGIEAPADMRLLELKPYVTSDLTSDTLAVPSISNDPGADVGIDVKYGVTQNLVADFTYNTDFAQVEADEQQVNLTRFSLFFPEKREFFLENQGTFAFGGAAVSGDTAANSDTPILFYSRRIGLNAGREVPIQTGGRLTGRVGRYSLGMLAIRADEAAATATPATTFSVLRVKRDLLRRSSIGAIFTARSKGAAAPPANEAFGVDGTFGFFNNLTINTYWAKSHADGVSSDDVSYRGQLEYAGDRYGVQVERLVVGDNFNPEVGFLRRDDMRKSFGLLRFSPRPKRLKSVRKVSWVGSFVHVANGRHQVETRDIDGEFSVEFQRSDLFVLAVSDNYDFLPRPFRISSNVTLPSAVYRYASVRTAYTIGQQRRISGTLSAEHGTFYNGKKTALAFTRPRIEITPRLAFEPSVSVNRVELDQGSFTTTLVGTRVTQAITPRMFVGALVQYNSDSHSTVANVRLRWEYRPGSELFVVFNEQRDTLGTRFPDLTSRALIVKINRLFRP